MHLWTQLEKSCWASANLIGIAQSADAAIAIAAILYVQFATTKLSGMRMRGQAIVTVPLDAIVAFARLFLQININGHKEKILNLPDFG